VTQASSGIVRSSAIIAVGSVLSRMTGLVSLTLLVAVISSSNALSDAYHAANGVPNILYELLVGGILSAALVPLLVARLDEEDHEATSAIVTVAVSAVGLATVAAFAAIPALSWFWSLNRPASLDVDAYRRVVSLLLAWFVPQIFFYGLVTIVTALLHARGRFAAAAFAPVVNNLVVIAVLLTLRQRGTDLVTPDGVLGRALDDRAALALLGAGTTAGVITTALVLLPALWGGGYRLRPSRRWRHPAVAQLLRMSGWMAAYVVANQVTSAVLVQVANLGPPGTVSAFDTAYRYFIVPHGLLAVSLITALLPSQARFVVRGDQAGLRHQYAVGLRMTALVITPAALAVVFLARPGIDLVTSRSADLDALSWPLVAFGVGLPGFSLYLYCLRIFFAHRDTRTPFRINLFENVVQIGLSVALGVPYGATGLAAAHSVAYTISAVVAFRAANLRVGKVPLRAVRPLVGVAAAAVCAATVTSAAFALAGWGGRTLAPVAALLMGSAVLAVSFVAYLWAWRCTGDLRWFASRVANLRR